MRADASSAQKNTSLRGKIHRHVQTFLNHLKRRNTTARPGSLREIAASVRLCSVGQWLVSGFDNKDIVLFYRMSKLEMDISTAKGNCFLAIHKN